MMLNELKATTTTSQNYMRSTYQLTLTADNPWDTYTFRQWKHFVANLWLSGVKEALKTGDIIKTMRHLFAPDRSAQAKGAHHSSKNNVQGMLFTMLFTTPYYYYHLGKRRTI
jgi:hypothetical protein